MPTPAHMAFIVGAYAVAAIVVVALLLWVLLDYRAQLRNLADLEKRGVSRRSTSTRSATERQRAKEQA
jgi:heme exporter protein D